MREETSSCGGRPNIIKGTNGADVLGCTPGNDVIYAYGGNDRIYGLGCNDSIIAGNGSDRVYLKDGMRDSANGGPGRDRCAADRQDAVSGCP